MMPERLAELRDFYHSALLEDYLPFWLRHGRDREHGGYHTCLNRDGSVYDHDKPCMWSQGRVAWTFAWLFNELEPRPEWLDMARAGVEFLRRYGFAPDGSMVYATTRDGRPLAPARDIYTELSTVCGFTEFARATADEALYLEARRVFDSVWERLQTPGRAFQPFLAQTRPVRMHGHSMITLNVLQELRRFRPGPDIEAMIDQCLHGVLVLHRRPERRAVLELVAWDGDPLPGPAGRWANPGHMMEAGIFVIHEGQRRQDARLVAQGAELIEWGFELGWDAEFGGVFNDVDLEGLPPNGAEALLYTSKLWWQHAEALYALLLALRATGDERFARAYEQVHRYSFEKFADPLHGEWFALLDRRGYRVNDSKGTSRKSCFHLCRNVFNAWRLLDDWTGGGQKRSRA